MPAAAEEADAERDCTPADLSRAFIWRMSTIGAIEAVRRKEKGLRVTCEVAPHH
jgi:dihydroorotase-like cyclic amidohydrolase